MSIDLLLSKLMLIFAIWMVCKSQIVRVAMCDKQFGPVVQWIEF